MYNDEKNEQYWLSRLCDRNPESRVQAAKYFWGQKALSATVRQALLGTLQDQDPSVREWGIMALTRAAGPPGALQARLLDLLRDARGDVRWHAVSIVDRMNLSSPEILGQLHGMREDEDPIVRRFVERALRRLQRRPVRAPAGGKREREEQQLPLFEVTWLEGIESKEERILQVFREVIAERTEDEQLRQLVAERMGLRPDQAKRIVDAIVTEATRVISDREVIAQAVAERGSNCQIGGCGFSFVTRNGNYAEGVYLPPPGRLPRRSERSAYIVILCPNHHKMLDLAQAKELYWDEAGKQLVGLTLNDEHLDIVW